MRVIVLTIVFSVVLSLHVTAQTCSYESGNLQGRIVYLNLASYDSGYEYIDSAEDCCNACNQKAETSCNAWTYCDDPNGCGLGCNDYMDQWRSARDNEDWDWIDKFAPYYWIYESLQKDSECGDKWPYKTCSLKVSDHHSRFVENAPAAEGWVSGHTGWKDKDSIYAYFACGYNVPPVYPQTPVMYQCPDDSCGARQSNIQAELIQLDVDAVTYKQFKGMVASTPAECCESCRSTSECGIWVYCSREDGCGSGCQQFVDQLNANNPEQPLSGVCTGDDKYRYRMCSLKKNGEYVEKTGFSERGWVSGVLA
eukprot:TRINITY_DN237_c0_g1_i1.p1 TRINITY_DN237_c0_g1~~TRINITY_DN237_c0_g1_i1.p1  ORF type:complete len:310 (-),score=15.72 TRINITY_DN237_c0_g1_i1:369-1298(-)